MIRTLTLAALLMGGLSLAVPEAALASPSAAVCKRKRRKKKNRKPEREAPPPRAEVPPTPPPATDDTRELRRGERVEFDARLIQGQTAKAGAVYLFERVSSNLRSMVRGRKSFRDKIVRPVYPKGRRSR